MKNGRINERNIGQITLDGNLKRRSNKKAVTPEQIKLAKEVLRNVLSSMEYDSDISERGRLHPEAKFTDGGRITLMLTGQQLDSLWNFIN